MIIMYFDFLERLNELTRNSRLSTCAGILWNLSSKDNLKQKLARETLPELTEKILLPLTEKECDGELSPSEGEIYYNTTGCLRYALIPMSRRSFSTSDRTQTSEDNAIAELILVSRSLVLSLSPLQKSELGERKDPPADERNAKARGFAGELHQSLPR